MDHANKWNALSNVWLTDLRVINNKDLEKCFMNTELAIKNRIKLLASRDPVTNANIIKKLKRKLRKIQSN